MSQERTVWLPWNSFYAMDTLVMKTEENSIPSCDLSGFVRPDPVIISSPLSTFFSDAPSRNPIVPETQVRAVWVKRVQKSVVRRQFWPEHWATNVSKCLCRAAFVLTGTWFSNEGCGRYPRFMSPRHFYPWFTCTLPLSYNISSISVCFSCQLRCFKRILQRLGTWCWPQIVSLFLRTKENSVGAISSLLYSVRLYTVNGSHGFLWYFLCFPCIKFAVKTLVLICPFASSGLLKRCVHRHQIIICQKCQLNCVGLRLFSPSNRKTSL